METGGGVCGGVGGGCWVEYMEGEGIHRSEAGNPRRAPLCQTFHDRSPCSVYCVSAGKKSSAIQLSVIFG